ncbi:MAG: hypothetical protein M3O34_06945 [Chloroflexota bacterium]|nr:hypothetical protein [Chloroflexota bacterium]
MQRFALLLVALGVLLACAHPAATPQATAAPRPSPTEAGGWLRGPDGRPLFLVGASYQGPADRAWRGDYWAWWADDRFDLALVAADFDRAAAAGLNSLRIFVQLELLRDIRKDVWWKLDAVVELASQRNLGLIVVFGDYDETRVERVARTSASIATRYAGNPTILAYELRNEPDFWVLQSARYPDERHPPLQSKQLVEAYGERAARHYTDAFRQTPEGKRGRLAIPGWFSDDETYYWHNNWLLSYALAQEASAWASANGRADVDFYAAPEAAHWAGFLAAVDATYAAWLEPQLRLIREADPSKPITVGHHDALLASLPANRQLDFITWHSYPPAGPSGHRVYTDTTHALRALYPDTPVLLGEFGYRATDRDERTVAIDEAAVLLRLYADGFAGGLKWMLTDTRDGTDSMGAFRLDGTARPITAATRALAALTRTPPVPGASLEVQEDGRDGLCYAFRAERAVFAGGTCPATREVGLRAAGPAQVFMTVAGDGAIAVSTTEAGRVALPLAVFGLGGRRSSLLLELPGGSSRRLTASDGQRVEFDVRPDSVYRVKK